jgi:formate dehydrogenase iron-sulfur subunit
VSATTPLPTPTFGGGYADGEERPRMGFFTDTSICIGCKACEVACKEWNLLPSNPLEFKGASFDNTLELNADNWRHVAFIEQEVALHPVGDGTLTMADGGTAVTDDAGAGVRWLMSSDVCKHCSSAACLEVCPTGALFRTEFGTVVVQEDICNGCGYCVSACPFGVISRREEDGRAFKCTLCYDRLKGGMEPACAHACPTDSIQFGPLDELRERAAGRLADLRDNGVDDARLYLSEDGDGIGGAGAFFLLLDEPEVYGLPPDPVSTTRDLPGMWKAAAVAAGTLAAGVVAAFLGGRR